MMPTEAELLQNHPLYRQGDALNERRQGLYRLRDAWVVVALILGFLYCFELRLPPDGDGVFFWEMLMRGHPLVWMGLVYVSCLIGFLGTGLFGRCLMGPARGLVVGLLNSVPLVLSIPMVIALSVAAPPELMGAGSAALLDVLVPVILFSALVAVAGSVVRVTYPHLHLVRLASGVAGATALVLLLSLIAITALRMKGHYANLYALMNYGALLTGGLTLIFLLVLLTGLGFLVLNLGRLERAPATARSAHLTLLIGLIGVCLFLTLTGCALKAEKEGLFDALRGGFSLSRLLLYPCAAVALAASGWADWYKNRFHADDEVIHHLRDHAPTTAGS